MLVGGLAAVVAFEVTIGVPAIPAAEVDPPDGVCGAMAIEDGPGVTVQ